MQMIAVNKALRATMTKDDFDRADLSAQRDRVLESVRTLIIGATPESGSTSQLPDLGVTPAVRHDGHFFIYPSRLSAHVRAMIDTGMAQFLAIEDEAKAQNIWARKRIKFSAEITEIYRQNDQFSVISDIFVSQHGPTMNLIRDFTDFHMLKLLPVSGVMVLGFAKAYQLEGLMLDIAAYLRES
tara:strand:+ start:518 stop:1069 length:552 start_codon:yes stop_codon:yes gene_type:complete